MQQTLWLSVGSNRKETSWKNVEYTWPSLVEKLNTPVITGETWAEFMKMDKGQQSERKDQGGWVGGTLTGGTRSKNTVSTRSVLTLDIDYGTLDFWDDFTMFYSCAAHIHGTHKHSEKEPRFRLSIPLSREVQPDEYEAIGRRVADNLDIELFDPTTFQPERLMFWPSIPKDMKFYSREQKGPWLDPDKVLKSYKDWKDQNQWAYSLKSQQEQRSEVKAQADPLEKTGVIGAFCRAFTITETIERFLSDVYNPTDLEDRWTYIAGSTFAGLVVYDDKFAYSHHSTDPTSSKLVNAFDLVRVHKFGNLDKNTSPRTNASKTPSFKAMMDFSLSVPQIGKEIAAEKIKKIKALFDLDENNQQGDNKLKGEIIQAEILENLDWMQQLEYDKSSQYLTTYRNIRLILENDSLIKGKIQFNELNRKLEVLRALPWDARGEKYPRGWTDTDWGCLRSYLGEEPYKLLRSPKLEDNMALVINKNRFHPIKQYLEGLEWDGEDRVDYLLEDYLGCQETAYIKAVTRKTLCAAVARVYQPGIKFDHVLTLVGKQGIGKSTLIRKLSLGWYTDTFNFNMLRGKEAFEQIQGHWLIEIGEMAGLKKAEIEAAKNFISSGTDTFRPSYGRETIALARQCIFIGTSNNPEFLKRANGNRRFWPADCGELAPVRDLWKDLTDEEVNQVWAEAVLLYKAGETLNLDAGMEAEAFAIQQAHEEINDQEGIIKEYLETLLPTDWEEKTTAERVSYFQYKDEFSNVGTVSRDKISAVEIWCECLKKNKGDLSPINSKPIHDILRNLSGWKLHKNKIKFKAYGVLVGYVRENSEFARLLEVEAFSNLKATGKK